MKHDAQIRLQFGTRLVGRVSFVAELSKSNNTPRCLSSVALGEVACVGGVLVLRHVDVYYANNIPAGISEEMQKRISRLEASVSMVQDLANEWGLLWYTGFFNAEQPVWEAIEQRLIVRPYSDPTDYELPSERHYELAWDKAL